MKLTSKIRKTIERACALHNGQFRKGEREGELPYVSHPFAVAWILSDHTDDEDVVLAGLLHDILEDVPNYGEEKMREEFGNKITDIVKGVSEIKDPNKKEDEKATWKYRKENYIKTIRNGTNESLLVCAADKIHNLSCTLDDIEQSKGAIFDKFNSTKEDILWFYKEVLSVLKERLDSELVNNYETLVLRFEKIVNSGKL